MGDTANTSSQKLNAAKVFVSYAREDKEFARQLSFALEDKGFGALMDVRAIVPGENWQLRLLNLIDQSTSIVVVLTDSYLNSEACGWEVTEAEKRGKRMLCVLPQRLTEGGKVPDVLARDQHIFFYPDSEVPDSGFYDGVRKLEMGLRQNLDWLTLQRRYELLADEWRSGKSETGLLIGSALAEARAWAAKPPERMRVPDEVAAFISASEHAEIKRQSKARRDRIVSSALTALGVLLLGASIYFGIDADMKRKALAATENESSTLANVAQTFADARIELADAEQRSRVGGATVSETDDLPLADATMDLTTGGLSGFRQADGLLKDLGNKGKERYGEFYDNVRRYMARSLHLMRDPESVAITDTLIAELAAATDDATLFLRSQDYIARAVYSCNDPSRIAKIGPELAAAPDNVRALYTARSVSKATGSGYCPEARQAICSIVKDCAVLDAIQPQPAIEDVIEIDEEPTLPPITTPPPAPVVSAEQQRTFAIRDIFLHIPQDADRPAAMQMKAQLEQSGFRVLGTELVKSKPGVNRSVRYYYAPQQAEAQDLVATVSGLASKSGLTQWSDPKSYRVVSLVGRYDGLPTNRIEVWF